jgi:hypothetical protein
LKFSKETLDEIRVNAKFGKDKDLLESLEKALEEINSNRHWKEEVEQWISVTESYWNVTQVYNELQAVTKSDKGAIRKAIYDLKGQDIIESWKNRGHGWYRRKETSLISIDWQNADENPIGIRLPLGMDEMINLYNGDIFIIAGESNAGKSAMCLNIVELNMDEWDCQYLSSELNGPKLKKRISLFDTPMELWKMPAYDRHDNYHDALLPNAINVIDFLMVTEDFWKVGSQIKDIHFALRKTGGIAIIALQKDPNKEFGRGGDITRELASLYITLSQPGRAKIIKLKDWKMESNPNYKICDYKLVNGSNFIQSTPWHYEEDEKAFTPRKRW